MNQNLELFVLKALKDNFVYVLHAPKSTEAVAIDPSTFEVVDDFLQKKGWGLAKILCTHHHPDHVGGAFELSKKYSAPIVCSQFDFERINGAKIAVSDGDTIHVANQTGKVILLPGHTLGHWALYLPLQNWIFVGDVLFSAGCGRLLEGTPEQMFQSFQKLKSLINVDTKIWFGHEYTLRNLKFVETHFFNDEVTKYQKIVLEKLARGESSTPTNLKTEMLINPMLKALTAAEFKMIREMRDQF